MSNQIENNRTDRFVEQILRSEPEFSLSDNFADKMSIKFERHVSLQNYLREFLIYLFAGIGLAGAAIAMFFFLMSDIWAKLVKWAGANLVELAGIALLLIFILFADRVMIRYFYLKTKRLS
jgi:hypothetical protein